MPRWQKTPVIKGGKRTGDFVSPAGRKARAWVNANFPEERRGANATKAWLWLAESLKKGKNITIKL